MFITHKILFPCATIVALFFTACDAGVSSTEFTIPDEPSAAIQTIADEMRAGNYSILWRVMPASYQADVNAIAQLAGTKVDAEIYDKSFSFLSRLAEVADKQKAYIINAELSSELSAEELAKLEATWPSIIGFVESIATSSISTSAGLQAFDGEVFFKKTFSDLFKYSKDLSVLFGEDIGDVYFVNLGLDSVKTLQRTDTAAVIEVTFTDGEADTLNLTRVENRWVPTELATNWSTQMADTKKKLEAISSEEMAKNKPQIMGMITMLDGILTQLEKAETQEEFDQAIEGAMIPIGLVLMQFIGEF